MNEITYGPWTTIAEIPPGQLCEWRDTGTRCVKCGPANSAGTPVYILDGRGSFIVDAANDRPCRQITLPRFRDTEPETYRERTDGGDPRYPDTAAEYAETAGRG